MGSVFCIQKKKHVPVGMQLGVFSQNERSHAIGTQIKKPNTSPPFRSWRLTSVTVC